MKTSNQSSLQNSSRAAASVPAEAVLLNVARLADAGQADKALALLSNSGLNSDAARNARGVCLLRLGRIDDALRLFRSLSIPNDCTWMKPELPVIYRTNFCTALLLAGHAGGARELLRSMIEQSHPSVLRLRQVLNEWQSTLSFWQKVQWKLGLELEVPVTVRFVPGEFAEPADAQPTDATAADSTAGLTLRAGGVSMITPQSESAQASPSHAM